MPWVAVRSNPNGAPMANTHCPTFRRVGVADLHGGQPLSLDLEQRDVGLPVAAHQLGRELALVVELDRDALGARDDVVVGDDVAVRGDDEAGAHSALHGRLVAERTCAWRGWNGEGAPGLAPGPCAIALPSLVTLTTVSALRSTSTEKSGSVMVDAEPWTGGPGWGWGGSTAVASCWNAVAATPTATASPAAEASVASFAEALM